MKRTLTFAVLCLSVALGGTKVQAEELRYDLNSDNAEIYETVTGQTRTPLQESLGTGSLSLLSALEYGLANNSDILLSRLSLDIVEAQELSSKGDFDPVLSASVDTSRNRSPFEESTAQALGFRTSDSISDSAFLSVSKQLRTGTTLSASSDVSRFEDRRADDPDLNNSSLRLSVSQPLLRGYGDDISDGGEKIAKLSTKAEQARLVSDVAVIAGGIIQNFWSYANASEILEIYKTSIARLNSVAGEFDALVAQGLYKEDDKSVIEARLAELESVKLAEEDSVRSARDNLGLNMGVENNDRADIPAPEYTLHRAKEISKDAFDKYLKYAVKNRQDLISRKIALKQSDIRLKQAENDMMPYLDVSGSVGKSRTREGTGFSDSFSTLYDGNSGNSWSAGLSFSYPLGNNAARGQLQEEKAARMSQELRLYDFERSLSFNVAESYERLESLRKQMTQNEQTFENFLTLYRTQLKDFRNGNASVFDLRQTEEDLTNAEINLASILIRYYQQLLSFRLDTETLLVQDQNGEIVFEEKRFLSAKFLDDETTPNAEAITVQ